MLTHSVRERKRDKRSFFLSFGKRVLTYIVQERKKGKRSLVSLGGQSDKRRITEVQESILQIYRCRASGYDEIGTMITIR